MTLAKTMFSCLLTKMSQRERHIQLRTPLSRLETCLTLKRRVQKSFLRRRVHLNLKIHQSSLISSTS